MTVYRHEFINVLLSIFSMSHFRFESKMNIDPLLLIGQGSPELQGDGYALVPDAHLAFQEMSAAAEKQGIKIMIVSSYRSFERQKQIWNKHFSNYKKQGVSDEQAILKIIQYSTIPGTSRHHWGTEIDIIDAKPKMEGDVLLTHKFHDQGPYNELRLWMESNANQYGFYLPYTPDEKRSGFKYEPWHYSFAPLSRKMLKQYLTLDLPEMIATAGLGGSNLLDENYLKNYTDSHILGIDPILL